MGATDIPSYSFIEIGLFWLAGVGNEERALSIFSWVGELACHEGRQGWLLYLGWMIWSRNIPSQAGPSKQIGCIAEHFCSISLLVLCSINDRGITSAGGGRLLPHAPHFQSISIFSIHYIRRIENPWTYRYIIERAWRGFLWPGLFVLSKPLLTILPAFQSQPLHRTPLSIFILPTYTNQPYKPCMHR